MHPTRRAARAPAGAGPRPRRAEPTRRSPIAEPSAVRARGRVAAGPSPSPPTRRGREPAPRRARAGRRGRSRRPVADAEAGRPRPPSGREPTPSSTRRRRPSPTSRPAEPPPSPRRPATVAELIAATLRAAGVRIAFTVPGESFLPVLDALDAAGIRIVATRHEGAAAFAAEAYGQLTGRPAACLGTRIVGAANLAIGIHTATADSTPMFVLVGQVDRGLRGREAFQEVGPRRHASASLAKWAGEIDDPRDGRGHARGGRPCRARGPARARRSSPCPRTCSTLPIPEGTRAPIVRPHPEAPTAVGHPRGPPLPRGCRAAGDPRRAPACCARGAPTTSSGSRSCSTCRWSPAWRRGDVIPNDHPLYLGMTGFGSPGRRPRAAWRRPTRSWSSARGSASRRRSSTGSRRTASAGCTWTSSRGPRRSGAAAGARPGDPRRRARLPAGRRGAPEGRRSCVAEPLAARDRHNARGPGGLGGGHDRRRRRLGRARDPSGPDRRGPPAPAARGRDPDHGCRCVRWLGRPRFPVPAARDVPRSDVGGHGVRRCRRPWRRRSSTVSGVSSRSSATAAWA